MTSHSAVVFRVGKRMLAADAAGVAAVARRPPLSRMPHAPAALAGIGAFNGQAMPVVELARLLDGGDSVGQQVLLLRDGEPAAVAVDAVEGIRDRSLVTCEWLDLRAAIAPVFQQRARVPRGFVGAAQPKTADAGREADFLAFRLAGQRFAFPMAQVRAVIREPAEVIAIPGSDPVALGVARYREGVIPVVELAPLLGLREPKAGGEVRLIVVEIAGAEVGLRVERALGAFRIPDRAVIPAPAALNRGAGEAVVAAVALAPSGLIAILAADRLFDDETMRRLQAMAVAAPVRQAASVEQQEVVVVFRVGEERYAAPAAAIEAVAPRGRLSPAPNAPEFIAGLMSHRGAALPVIDARLRFGAAAAARGVVIVVRRDAVAVGLWVDAVEGLARLPHSALTPAQTLAGDAGALLTGMAAQDAEGKPLLVIDPDALLAQARRDVTARSASHPRRDRA